MGLVQDPQPKMDPFGNKTTVFESGQIAAYKDSRWRMDIETASEALNTKDMVQSLAERVVQCGHIFSDHKAVPFGSAWYTEFKQDDRNPRIWHVTVQRSYLD